MSGTVKVYRDKSISVVNRRGPTRVAVGSAGPRGRMGHGLEIDATGTFSDRTTYDDEAEGFIFASTDGDGDTITTAVAFRKESNDSADWSDPIGIQSTDEGPAGAAATIAVGDVTTGVAGSSAAVQNVGTSSAAVFDFTIPRGNQGVAGLDGASSLGIRVHLVDTGEGDPADDYEAGDTVDGETLVAGQVILRATSGGDSGDGPYIVPASGAAARHSSYTTFDSLCGIRFACLLGTHAGKDFKVTSEPGGTIDSDPLEIEEQTGGVAPQTQVFTADGTYTRTAGCKSVDIIVVGAGGGSSGCEGGTDEASLGNAGAAGAEAHLHMDFELKSIEGVTQDNPGVVTSTAHGFNNGTVLRIAGVAGMTELNGNTYTVANAATDTFELSGTDTSGFGAYSSGGTLDFASCPVTVGEGGLAGDTTPSAGGDGEDTSFGDYCWAEGAEGGTITAVCSAGTTETPSNVNFGGDDGDGDIVIPGSNSFRGLRLSGTVLFGANTGANHRFGRGGRTAGNTDGFPGVGYGAGAGGPMSTNGVSRNGAAGAPGVVFVTENF